MTDERARFTSLDGSYTEFNPSTTGLKWHKNSGDSGKDYHYLFYSGEVTFNGSILAVTLPSEFKGKNFVVNPFFITADSAIVDGTASTVLKYFGINFQNNSSYIDYNNAVFNFYAYSTFVTTYSDGHKDFTYGKPKIGFIVTA